MSRVKAWPIKIGRSLRLGSTLQSADRPRPDGPLQSVKRGGREERGEFESAFLRVQRVWACRRFRLGPGVIRDGWAGPKANSPFGPDSADSDRRLSRVKAWPLKIGRLAAGFARVALHVSPPSGRLPAPAKLAMDGPGQKRTDRLALPRPTQFVGCQESRRGPFGSAPATETRGFDFAQSAGRRPLRLGALSEAGARNGLDGSHLVTLRIVLSLEPALVLHASRCTFR